MYPFHIYFTNINTRDYPDFTRVEHDLWKPGLILGEHYALSGIRVVVPIGCALSMMYFYLYHLPRLPLVKRPVANLGHFIFPTVAYSTPVGLLGGLVYGAFRERSRFQDDVLADTLREQRQAVEEALRHYETRRSRAAARVEASLPWYAKLLVSLRLARDPVEMQLWRMGLGRKSWQDLVERNSLLWVSIRNSKVNDARWYRKLAPADDLLCESKMVSTVQQGDQKGVMAFVDQGDLATIDRGAHSRKHFLSDSTLSTPTNPHFSKLQTDALVSRVMQLRESAEESRWMRTGGRFSFYGMATMLVMLNSGSMLYRTSVGLGFGVLLGATISATQLDDVFTHLR